MAKAQKDKRDQSFLVINIPSYLADLLDQLIKYRTKEEPFTQSKQLILTEAIASKLKNDAKKIKKLELATKDYPDNLKPKKYGLRINEALNDEIERHVGLIKKHSNYSCTKTGWIADAILEFIDKDPEILKKLKRLLSQAKS